MLTEIKLKRVQPKPGDKLYRVSWFDHNIEVVTFVREQVLEGAVLPTWTLKRNDGQRFITHVGAYEVTPYLAWRNHAQQLEKGVKDQQQAIKDARKRLKEGKEQLARAKEMVRRSGPLG